VIALIDYGAGNLASVRKALVAVGVTGYTAEGPQALGRAQGIIVPGVGHFAATATLGSEWRSAVLRAIDRGVPVLGICLGMQWLFEGSDESPEVPGLAVLPDRITRLPDRDADGGRIKVPHVGWNRINHPGALPMFQGVPPGAFVYFTHAYAAPVTPAVAATTTHGVTFASAIACGSVWGVQFHPEKSGAAGLAVLRNFAAATRRSSDGMS
jgi:glutamine amidotransferase